MEKKESETLNSAEKIASSAHHNTNTTLGQSISAGAIAGCIESIAMYPTEFVKTQLQLQSKKTPKFTGPINVVTVSIKEHGFFALYRGLSSLIVGSVPKAAVRFSSFEIISQPLKDAKGKLSATSSFLSGLAAGASEALLVVTPMETIKTRFIHDLNAPPEQRKYKGLIHGVSTITKEEGISGIYKGLLPTILKQSTNQATRFLVFGELKKWFQGPDSTKPFPVLQSILSGGIAGGVSVFVNNPLDVIKTKMQGLESKQYRSSLDCARSILKNQGPMFFYKGVSPRLVRVCGDAAISFTVYNRVLEFIKSVKQ